ncbi:sugar transferase [soil metagenome]
MITETPNEGIKRSSKTVIREFDLPHDCETITLCIPKIPIKESIGFRVVKRSADVAIATTALAVFSPLLLGTALAIWAEDKGPILYRQKRIGRFGVPFSFYKFRSMRIDADRIRAELLHQSDCEGAAFKMKNDPRITKIGRFIRKFSIDEMPQLFSVLAGHMSIVGPRPHLQEEVDTYSPTQRVRLLVRPGLLCLREIRGRSHLSFEEWVNFDIEYVREQSLALDAKIFFLAIPAVISARGAY